MIWQHMVSGCWQGGKDWASDGGERVLCYTRRCKHSTDSCVSRVCWQWPQPLSKTSTLCCPNLKPTTITSHLPERGKVSVPSASHVTPSLQRDTFVCMRTQPIMHQSTPVYSVALHLLCFVSKKAHNTQQGCRFFLLNGGTEFASRRWSENKTKTKKGLQISPFSTKLQARL